jgi:hypothetical protein
MEFYLPGIDNVLYGQFTLCFSINNLGLCKSIDLLSLVVTKI